METQPSIKVLSMRAQFLPNNSYTSKNIPAIRFSSKEQLVKDTTPSLNNDKIWHIQF